jgi:Fic family protein
MGSLLRTRSAELFAATAIARAEGVPFDAARVDLFRALADELVTRWGQTSRPRGPLLREEAQHLAFVESYFSNYIEGTKFDIEEAREIVFEDKIPEARPLDSHDILGTFELLVDDSEMKVSVTAFDNFEDVEYLLKRRHARIMSARVDKRPGEFKARANRAGNTLFVAPELVRGTLAQAFRIAKNELGTPFQRAVFMMFVISEVHPFDDGNGRLARVMMNAELAAAEENRVLIVTSYRPDYLGALRRLSRSGDTRLYPRMVDRAHEFSYRLDYLELEPLLRTLLEHNAFNDSETRIMTLPPPRDL